MSTENETTSVNEWLETAAVCLSESSNEDDDKELAENVECAKELARLLARFGSKQVLSTIRNIVDYAGDMAENAVHDRDVPTTKETVAILRDLAKQPLKDVPEKL